MDLNNEPESTTDFKNLSLNLPENHENSPNSGATTPIRISDCDLSQKIGFIKQLEFVHKLTDMVDKLRSVDRTLRGEILCRGLKKLNEKPFELGANSDFLHFFMFFLHVLFLYLLIHSIIHSCIHSFIHSFIHLLAHKYNHSFIHPIIYSCIHSFIHSFIHSPIPLYLTSLLSPLSSRTPLSLIITYPRVGPHITSRRAQLPYNAHHCRGMPCVPY